MNEAIRMQISAFVDGELPDSEVDLLLRRMSQDPELRREAAEFLQLGRVLRGEAGVRGIERLRERIATTLDDKVFEDVAVETGADTGKSIRPLLGFAVAASVALLALFSLQFVGVDNDSGQAIEKVADAENDAGYTVPQAIDADLRHYYLSHGASSSELGANGMNARLVTLRLSNDSPLEEQSEAASPEETAPEDAATDDPSTRP